MNVGECKQAKWLQIHLRYLLRKSCVFDWMDVQMTCLDTHRSTSLTGLTRGTSKTLRSL